LFNTFFIIFVFLILIIIIHIVKLFIKKKLCGVENDKQLKALI